MEQGPVEALFESPSHPYTRGLLGSVLRIDETIDSLPTIPGSPPNMLHAPTGCPFEPRCEFAMSRCAEEKPMLTSFSATAPERERACHVAVNELMTPG
jgi:oligopeptide transport system ATP-binding protein